MSTILAFDTHAGHISCALWNRGKVVAQSFEVMKRGQVEHLFSHIQAVLSKTQMGHSDLDALGVGIGPGNFTGIRVAIAAAQGLSFSLGIPAHGVSALDAIAHQAPDAKPVISAMAGQFYTMDETGQIVLATLEDFARLPNKVQIAATPEASEKLNRTSARIPDHPAIAIAEMTAQRLERGVAAQPLAPLYVRPPDAAPPKTKAPRIIGGLTPSGTLD